MEARRTGAEVSARNCSHVPQRPEHSEPFINAQLQSEMQGSVEWAGRADLCGRS